MGEDVTDETDIVEEQGSAITLDSGRDYDPDDDQQQALEEHRLDLEERRYSEEVGRLRDQIDQIVKWIDHNGGNTGGWDDRDHKQYLQVLTQTTSTATHVFLQKIVDMIPMHNFTSVQQHHEWYENYKSMVDRRKDLLADWRALKREADNRARSRELLIQQNKELEAKKKSKELFDVKAKEKAALVLQWKAAKREQELCSKRTEQEVIETEEREKKRKHEEERKKLHAIVKKKQQQEQMENAVAELREAQRALLEEQQDKQKRKEELKKITEKQKQAIELAARKRKEAELAVEAEERRLALMVENAKPQFASAAVVGREGPCAARETAAQRRRREEMAEENRHRIKDRAVNKYAGRVSEVVRPLYMPSRIAVAAWKGKR